MLLNASAPSNSYKSIAFDTFHTNIPPEAISTAEEGEKPPDIDMVYRIVWAYCVGDKSSGWVPSKGTNSIRITRPNLITGHEDEDPVVEGKDAERRKENSANIDGSEELTQQIPCEVAFRYIPYQVDYTCLYDTTTETISCFELGEVELVKTGSVMADMNERMEREVGEGNETIEHIELRAGYDENRSSLREKKVVRDDAGELFLFVRFFLEDREEDGVVLLYAKKLVGLTKVEKGRLGLNMEE